MLGKLIVWDGQGSNCGPLPDFLFPYSLSPLIWGFLDPLSALRPPPGPVCEDLQGPATR